MTKSARFALLPLVLAATALPAQRTWIVDAAGGAGVDFHDIQAGVNAAADGDTLLVRAGTYGGFRVAAKGLSILGEAGVQIQASAAVRIESTAPGQRVTVADLDVPWDGVLFVPTGVFACQGPVLLERVRLGTYHYGFTADGATDLRLSQCSIQCGATVRSSHAIATDSVLAYNRLVLTPAVGLAVAASTVVLSRCQVNGQSAFNRAGASSAMSLDPASVVTITDDGSHTCSAGTGGIGPLPAVVGAGRLIRDPRVVVLGSNGAPGVQGPVEVIRSIATLQVLGALPGGHVDVELAAAAGAVWALVVGLPGALLPAPELGGSLAVTGFFFVAGGVAGATPFRLSLPVAPGMPAGQVLCWQAVAGDGQAVWQLTNPATYARTR